MFPQSTLYPDLNEHLAWPDLREKMAKNEEEIKALHGCFNPGRRARFTFRVLSQSTFCSCLWYDTFRDMSVPLTSSYQGSELFNEQQRNDALFISCLTTCAHLNLIICDLHHFSSSSFTHNDPDKTQQWLDNTYL